MKTEEMCDEKDGKKPCKKPCYGSYTMCKRHAWLFVQRARMQLHVHGLLPDSEDARVRRRIAKAFGIADTRTMRAVLLGNRANTS